MVRFALPAVALVVACNPDGDVAACDGDILTGPDGSQDCATLGMACGLDLDGLASCYDTEAGGSNDDGTPRFLHHPLAVDSWVRNGWQYNYEGNGAGLQHSATDFALAGQRTLDVGTDVHAPCAGVAMASTQYANNTGYGRFVQIRCDDTAPDGRNYHVILAHLSSFDPAIRRYPQESRRNAEYGDWTPVQLGQRVGASGSDDTYWPHLHMEVNTGQYQGRPKLDPYDIYATTTTTQSAEEEYPPEGERFDGCGANPLWVECPPSAAGLEPVCVLSVPEPVAGAIVRPGDPVDVAWNAEGACFPQARVHLYRGQSFVRTLAAEAANTGALVFNPPADLEPDDTYAVCISTLDDAFSTCGQRFVIAEPCGEPDEPVCFDGNIHLQNDCGTVGPVDELCPEGTTCGTTAEGVTCVEGESGDEDGDGFGDDVDCAPSDPARNPSAMERANLLDDDCDGQVDEGLREWWSRRHYSDGATCASLTGDWDHCFSRPGSMNCVGVGQGGGLGYIADGVGMAVYPASVGGGQSTVVVQGGILNGLISCYSETATAHFLAVQDDSELPAFQADPDYQCTTTPVGYVMSYGPELGAQLVYRAHSDRFSDFLFGFDDGAGAQCTFGASSGQFYAWPNDL